MVQFLLQSMELRNITYADMRRAVGLYGGAERLPSLAFNTRDGSKVSGVDTITIITKHVTLFMPDSFP